MKIALIPARGGSKRIPRKNVKDFCGKPMIAWSIEAAVESNLFDRVIISTDDAEIAEIATALGAEVPFIRPPELSNDFAVTVEVIEHAIVWLEKNGIEPEHICCIYATAPFIRKQYLKEALVTLQECDKTEFVVPVVGFEYPILRALQVDDQKNISMIWPEHETTRSQDLAESYHDVGQFYWGTRTAWLSKKNIFSAATKSIVLPAHLVQDVDTPEDWKVAELKFRALQG